MEAPVNKIEDILKTVGKENEQLTPEKKAEYEEVIKKIYLNDNTLKEAMNFSNEFMELFYTYGYKLHSTGKFKEAIDVFIFLTTMDLTKGKYWIGLGACWQNLKEWQKALNAYYKAFAIDIIDPFPPYEMGQCLLNLGADTDALKALLASIKRCGNTPEYAQLKERALLLANGISEKLFHKPITFKDQKKGVNKAKPPIKNKGPLQKPKPRVVNQKTVTYGLK